ncbi:MAG: DUF697 domain-containing protein [Clostridia bacterium]|nr:DUF697 domain-containing protein [Clostridia bacterium]
MKKTKALPAPADDKYDEVAFSDSISSALKQKNEKRYFFAILAVVAVVVLLIVGALADLLALCFQVNQWFGYAACAVAALLVFLFILRPTVKVIGARFFITDVTADTFNAARRKNYRALRSVAGALVEYNTDPKNMRFRYLTQEKCDKLSEGLKGEKEELKAALKEAYASEVGPFANKLIWKSAGKVFLTTSISQNDKIDALSVLLVNLSLVKKIVAIYGYRPSFSKLFRIYFTVLRSALLAYGMQNVNWFNVFGKFFSGVAKKIPFLDTIVDSATQGTVSAFMTLLVGYKTKRYLCSDYKKQEKLDAAGEDLPESADDEVRIAASLAKEIRRQNARAEEVAATE